MWMWGYCARFFLLVSGRPLVGRQSFSCFSHFLDLFFPLIPLPDWGFWYRVMVMLLRGAEFELTGYGMLVVGRPLVLGDVFSRLLADFTVGVIVVGGGTYNCFSRSISIRL